MFKNPTHTLKIHPFSIIKMNTGDQKNRNKKKINPSQLLRWEVFPALSPIFQQDVHSKFDSI